jgi:CubicO group peptidase (beta-lactamase class C family)
MSNEMDSPSHGINVVSWLDELATISRIKNLMNDFHVPGLAVAIVDGSEIRSRAFGNASLDPQTPCTPDTVFDIASCSKALTSLAVALLVENEHEFSIKVQWDSLMSSLLPDDFALSTAEATNVVIVEHVERRTSSETLREENRRKALCKLTWKLTKGRSGT